MPGVLPMVAVLARRGLRRVVVAAAAVDEARLVDGVEVVGVETLSDAVAVIRTRRARRTPPAPRRIELVEAGGRSDGDAATDGVPWVGPPPVRTCARSVARPRPGAGSRSPWPAATACCSSGRRARARRSWRGPSRGSCRRSAMRPRWRRPSSPRLRVRARSPSSVGGRRFDRRITRSRTPGMVGGGPNMSPGEITRADQGVLFLDELPEFGRDVLEALRQPMEEGRVAVSRVGRATIFPARFQLVAAMNPCPCGFAGSSDRACALPAARPGAIPAADLRPVARPDRPVDLDAARRTAGARAWSRAGRDPRSSGRGSRRRGPSQWPVPAATLNGRLTGRALRDACRLDRPDRATDRRSSPTSNGPADAAPSACFASRGRSRISPGGVRSGRTHLDEAAWFRPADMRLAAAEVV